MKPEQDIGKLIRQKLDSMEFRADEALWEKVDNSLNKKARARRLWVWLGGGTVLLLVLASTVLVATISNETAPTSAENVKADGEVIRYSNYETSTTQLDTIGYANRGIFRDASNPYSAKAATEGITDGSKTNTQNEYNVITINSWDDIDEKENSEASNSNDMFSKENNVKTTYYYYRSGDSTHVASENKAVIDSLMKVSIKVEQVKDSLNN